MVLLWILNFRVGNQRALVFFGAPEHPQSHWIGLTKNWSRKPAYFMVISLVSCRFSLEPSQWCSSCIFGLNSDGFQPEEGPGGSWTRKLSFIFLMFILQTWSQDDHDTLWQFDIVVGDHYFILFSICSLNMDYGFDSKLLSYRRGCRRQQWEVWYKHWRRGQDGLRIRMKAEHMVWNTPPETMD